MRRLFAVVALALALVPGAARAQQGAREAPVALGAFIHDSYRAPRLYDAYSREAGRPAVVLGAYKSWTISAIDPPQLDAIWRRGAVPMVTWEPWGGRKAFLLRDIARGRYDRYIRRSARQAAAWGHPLFIRFAQEMNGNWYPWGSGVNGNRPRDYKAAWRRIVRAFRAAGADNAIWVWSPNQNFSGRFPFRQFYPGGRWVDWIGIDGFNWARSPRWQSFTQIFASSYDSIVAMTAKPVMIAETGSWERGGSKAAWVADALRSELPRFPHIRALVWWSVRDPRGDLRVNSSVAAAHSLRAAARGPRYAATRSELLATPARLAGRAGVATSGGGESAAQRLERELHDNYVWLGTAVLVVCLATLAYALLRARHRGPAPPPAGHDAPS